MKYALNASFMEQLAIAQLDKSAWYWVSVQRHVVSVVEQDVVLVNCCSQLSYLLLDAARYRKRGPEHTAH